MPAIADLPQQSPIVHVRPVADAFGNEGVFVCKAAERAVTHWEDRAEWILTHSSESDELDYESVPLKVVGSIKVRCTFIGPLKPMPYEWNE